MGLAVSQVRLLALTRRKADIELDIQIDSKRKQALTRKSTELSQMYYQKLQQAKVQYATDDGYENVNYDYIMGKSDGSSYNDDFLKQVLFMYGNLPQKTCSSMILTDKMGKVVLNDELAGLVAMTKICYGQLDNVEQQAAETIKAFIDQNSNVQGYGAADYVTGEGFGLAQVLEKLDKEDSGTTASEIIVTMLRNGGYMDGGTVYLVDGTTDEYVKSAELAKHTEEIHSGDRVFLQNGYNYNVYNSNCAYASGIPAGCMYLKGKGFIKNTEKSKMQYLSNIVSYFGPMITAALKNGATTELESINIKGIKNENLTNKGKQTTDKSTYDSTGAISSTFLAAVDGILSNNSFAMVTGADKVITIWKKDNAGNLSQVTDLSSILTEVADEDGHREYINARDTKLLQAGFQSGMYQLCMVDNIAKGRYHKNTTLEFFVQMSYVSEKVDSSEREQIMAWFNSEQAKISDQETYWDTEITNLSTELSSVNTEIDSVKSLKSNAIKSVFDWGNS